ncbi:MAG: 2-oxo acid dehydrogenase subunit E2 [Actinomycetota bacterium]|nr:2-oxo acid dehydrogenase subunit E2 [Actinomycetota bacterium]
MPVSVTMPRLGESVTEGTVTRWLKNEGDHVETDEPLLEVSTDKVDTEVPSPASGTVLSIKVAEDETVEIGVELAVIGDAGESTSTGESPPAAQPAVAEQSAPPEEPVPADQSAPAAQSMAAAESAPTEQAEAAPSPQAPSPQAPSPEIPEAAVQAPPTERGTGNVAGASATPARSGDDDDDVGGPYVTPLVRKLAGQHGVDLSTVRGTGIGGRIRKSDVLAASTAPATPQRDAAPAMSGPAHASTAPSTTAPSTTSAPASPAVSASPAPAATTGVPGASTAPQRGRVEPMSRMRQVIAARMVESLQIAAQLTTVVEVDVTRISRLRDQAKAGFEAREGVKLTFLPFFAIAAIEALKAHPVVNSSIDVSAKTITFHDTEHVGIAVDTDRGLAVPVIHNAGDLNLGGIARKIVDLAERTRANKISPDELGGGTFTITNTGSRGALFDTPIINQPQVAILGTGAVVRRAVVVSDEDLGETIAIRSMVYLALSYDHRIVDGADAARFLATVKQRLEAGAFERALGLG